MKVELSNYSEGYGSSYASKNPNTQLVTIGDLEIFFSYSTPVAYRTSSEFIISENAWSTTTGRHLNIIHPDKTRRVPREVFEQKLADIAASIGIEVA
ncbi:MAG: hypothetical protein WC491_08120 [Candidatus Omnitrophota bacterium]